MATRSNEGPVLLVDDPLNVFDNDDVGGTVDPIQDNTMSRINSNLSNISSSSNDNNNTPLLPINEDTHHKLPYPEDVVDDEGQLVDEHDEHHHDDDDALDADTAPTDESAASKPSPTRIHDSNPNAIVVSKRSPSTNRKKKETGTMRKAPQAPKRFKSSYICFFTSKQSEIKEILGQKATVMEVSKKSAQMWKELGTKERAHWEDVAAKDKERYMMEKAAYSGPWQVPYKRAKKDPSAPKRPMSAFLLFSQKRRGVVKEGNPGMKNTDVSRMLGEEWRSCSDAQRLPFVEEELALREKYKVALAEWKDKEGERKEEELKRQKEQMEWHQKHLQQLAMEKSQMYSYHHHQQQQRGSIHGPPMDAYAHPVYMMPPPPQAQGYPTYQQQAPQGYPPQYAAYPPQGYQYPAVPKQQPTLLTPNGLPQYPQQHVQQQQQILSHHHQLQHHQQQQSPLPTSSALPSEVMYYQHPVPSSTSTFNGSPGPGLLADTD